MLLLYIYTLVNVHGNMTAENGHNIPDPVTSTDATFFINRTLAIRREKDMRITFWLQWSKSVMSVSELSQWAGY